MKFQLTIDCENAAFEDNPGLEIRRILLRLTKNMDNRDTGDHSPEEWRLMDLNGNAVGRAVLR